MQFLKVSWIFREQDQTLTRCITQMNFVELSIKARIEWGDDFPTDLTKQPY